MLTASAPNSSRLAMLTRRVKSPAAISLSRASISRIGPTSDSEIVRPRIRARAMAPRAKPTTIVCEVR